MKILYFILFICVAINANAKFYKANKDVNIRTGAGIIYPVSGLVKSGTTVEITEIIDTWGKLKTQGNDAYISVKFLDELSDPVSTGKNVVQEDNNKSSNTFLYLIIVILIFYAFRKSSILRLLLPSTMEYISNFGRNSNSTYEPNRRDSSFGSQTSKNKKINYICEFCGTKFSSVFALTGSSCPRHPNGFCKGKHSLYQGNEKSEYTCKFCGHKSQSIFALTGSSCPRHPNGTGDWKHEPAL